MRSRGPRGNFTQLDYEFEDILKNMSCVAVMRLPYSMRCMMVTRAEDCHRIINFFNYFRLMYCSIDIDSKAMEILFMCLFVLICVAFLWLMSFNISNFFSPVLKIVCLKLHMNEYLAGVTFLAFGNSCPDLIANLMPVRADAPIFTIAVANALAIILLSGGTVCFLRPFKMNGPCILRDLLFLLLGVEVLRLVIVKGGRGNVTMWETLGLFSVYVVYVTINIIDLVLMRSSMKKLRRELAEMRSLPFAPREAYLAKLRKLTSWEEDDDVPIHDTTIYRHSRALGSHFSEATNAGYFVTPKRRNRPKSVDVETNRTTLYNEENPKNLLLFREFFESLNPIDYVAWELGGCCQRLLLIIRSPLVLVLLVFIPVVDFEKDKHGWSKLLNCLQIVLNPFLVITLVHSAVASEYHKWYIILNFSISMWSPCLTLPLAIVIFMHSRTDVPPCYHLLFALLTFFSSMMTIWIAVTELEVLSEIVGIVFNLSENFMSATIGAISNATPDMIANSQLALQGYGRMAFAAIIGGPVFAIVVSMSLAFVFNKRVRHVDADSWMFGEHGEICYVFLLITIFTTLWLCSTFDFHARRSVGVFLWSMFLLFLLYAICVEFELIHDLSRDPRYNPI